MSINMDFNIWQYFLFVVLGFIVGIINMLAGGGSNLILPVLMILGVDPQVANGTNRIGIWCQSVSGIIAFTRHKRLPTDNLFIIILPIVLGGVSGALLAAKMDILLTFLPSIGLSKTTIIKIILLGTMLIISTIIFLKPHSILHIEHEAIHVKDCPRILFWLWLGGVYGGFVQAGVGFILLTIFAGILRYDIVHATALKVLCTLGFTSVALIIFIGQGQVLWLVGILLACGNAIGAWVGVKVAININNHILRWILFIMTLIAILAAFF